MAHMSGANLKRIIVPVSALAIGLVLASLAGCRGSAGAAPPAPQAGKTNSVDGATLVFVPGGAFPMGDNRGLPDETPVRRASEGPFWIYKTEVTNAQYKAFLDANPWHEVPFVKEEWAQPYNWDPVKRTYPAGKENHPVVLVSFQDAQDYCRWAGVMLPTETQWEKAARGTNGLRWPWGNHWDWRKCNTWEGGKRGTVAVGSYAAGGSPYGVLDMAGNVAEWTALERPGGTVVVKGGAWYWYGVNARCAFHAEAREDLRLPYIGFRCVSIW